MAIWIFPLNVQWGHIIRFCNFIWNQKGFFRNLNDLKTKANLLLSLWYILLVFVKNKMVRLSYLALVNITLDNKICIWWYFKFNILLVVLFLKIFYFESWQRWRGELHPKPQPGFEPGKPLGGESIYQLSHTLRTYCLLYLNILLIVLLLSIGLCISITWQWQ